MNKLNRIKEIAFVTNSLSEAFLKLNERKFEDKQLFRFINRAMDDLKENPFCGIRIPKRLWPLEYIKKYSIVNLWKYNLPNSWRLVYTIKEDKISILSVILDWFNHRDYERKFKY